MPVVSFGSLNLDHTYYVDQIVSPGQTITASALLEASGGKGLNQAVALTRGGSKTWMAGQIGHDGQTLVDQLEAFGVDTHCVEISEHPTGHAIIQLDSSKENSIIVFGGANHHIDDHLITRVLDQLTGDDLLVLQNEIRPLDRIWDEACRRAIPIAFNPSPCDEQVFDLNLSQARYLFVNQGEARALASRLGDDLSSDHEQLLDTLTAAYPDTAIIMTLGGDGAYFAHGKQQFFEPARTVTPVDSTGAGDTFTGFFLAEMRRAMNPAEALRVATCAASLAIGKPGAASSIPSLDEVHTHLT